MNKTLIAATKSRPIIGKTPPALFGPVGLVGVDVVVGIAISPYNLATKNNYFIEKLMTSTYLLLDNFQSHP